MKAVVVYETLWGNTEQVASAIGHGLQEDGAEVIVTDVQDLTPAATGEADLLVVGGPTHGWGMSKPSSRKVRTGPTHGRASAPRRTGIREWLDVLTPDRACAFAAFDTRLNRPRWMTGSAARSIAKALKRRGYPEVTRTESFRVAHSDGPLVVGEVERAEAWGRDLVTKVVRAA